MNRRIILNLAISLDGYIASEDGGGGLVDPFIKADLVDEYIIGIIPIILGKGRPLFLRDNPTINLTLKDYSVSEGITVLKYTRQAK